MVVGVEMHNLVLFLGGGGGAGGVLEAGFVWFGQYGCECSFKTPLKPVACQGAFIFSGISGVLKLSGGT